MKIPGLRSGREQVGGLVFFGRMLDKARLHAAGKLPEGYFRGNGPDGTCLDGRVCRFLNVDYDAVYDLVLLGGSDEEILTWCHTHGRKPNEEEHLIFNAFMLKRGWRDTSSPSLATWKMEAGFSHRDDIQTWIDLQDADESEAPRQTVTTTYLEIKSTDTLHPKTAPDSFVISEVQFKLGAYSRFFYLQVGSPWQWTDKVRWTESQWDAYASREDLRTFVGYYEGAPCGYAELVKDGAGDVQIAYFGLLPQFIGRGLGGALLTQVITHARSWGEPSRVWVHTCTLDHVAAIANYQARGMTIYKTETFER
ncbi:MAG: GNAT family N-acetyltransferase [Verrucomicrobiota bacterium]|nr:GNAT family N-acetyltransferase [Verrucomicrobiota bacterium]